MPSQLPVRSFLAVIVLVLASSCQEQNEMVKCGMPLDDGRLRSVLAENQGCPNCLLEQIRQVSVSCPQDPALGMLGFYASERANRSDAAMEYYRRIEGSLGVSYQVHADAGSIYSDAGDKNAAIIAYQRSLALHRDPFVGLEMAFLLQDTGLSDAAIEEFKKVMVETERARLDARPGEIGDDVAYDDATFALAELFESNGEIDAARSVYQKYLDLFPENDRAEKALQALSSPEK